MKTKKNAIIAGMILALIVLASAALIFGMRNEAAEVPEEVTKLIEDYMAAYQEGVEKSVELAWFRDESIREAYITTGDKLIDYEIQSIEKINDELYEVNVLMKSEQSVLNHGDEFQPAYNFAAKIDGQWRYLNGIAHIPDELRENLDAGKYVYEDENVLEWWTEPLN